MLMSSSEKAAKLYYGASSFRVLRPGQHVICAVTAEVIPLEELLYWSAEHQEAYASPEIATRRLLGEG
ncbi:hypothetical protein CD351_02395 [Erythrobacter sp. KY5]|uniref:DUF2093 domain-containing protein n=1 Tax=Erythrobacter sp. KY5 TaxID=2011159 RepID=UPI000DBF04C9|nr:DUF2093 domain-containing protein [Erythrobacter sp. KY5]AWW73273.1 hypothetical protein CD351_02395 [Erythrobacter sp. KY5]